MRPVTAPKVVVLNDDDAYLETVGWILEEVDPSITTVLGKKALDGVGLVKDGQPDLVILDVVFEHEQLGWTVLEQLKIDPQTARIPVLMCTATARTTAEQMAMLARYDVPTLSKPFDLDEFIATVTSVLRTCAQEA